MMVGSDGKTRVLQELPGGGAKKGRARGRRRGFILRQRRGLRKKTYHDGQPPLRGYKDWRWLLENGQHAQGQR